LHSLSNVKKQTGPPVFTPSHHQTCDDTELVWRALLWHVQHFASTIWLVSSDESV